MRIVVQPLSFWIFIFKRKKLLSLKKKKTAARAQRAPFSMAKRNVRQMEIILASAKPFRWIFKSAPRRFFQPNSKRHFRKSIDMSQNPSAVRFHWPCPMFAAPNRPSMQNGKCVACVRVFHVIACAINDRSNRSNKHTAQTKRPTYRQADRHTYRQTYRQTDRQTDRQTNR